MAGMSDENQSHREDTATAEDADHGTEEAKTPGSPFFLLFAVLSVPPMPNLAVTQLTEEPVGSARCDTEHNRGRAGCI